MTQHPAPPDESGISLVEMLVAILILGVVLAGMARTIIGSLTSVQGQERLVQATALGNELAEELQALPWEGATLCSTEVMPASAFGGLTFGGRPLVVNDDTDCTTRGFPKPVVNGVTRNGLSFDVRRAIVWEDDLSDNDPVTGVDPDGAEDFKRFILTISWLERGSTRSTVVESVRSPGPDEQPITTELAPLVVYTNDAGTPNNTFVARAFTDKRQQTVTLSYVQSDPTVITTNLGMTPNSSFTTWQREILPGTQKFPNGETLFEFKATDPDGNVLKAFDRALFLRPAKYVTKPLVRNRQVATSGGLAERNVVYVRADGLTCPFTVSVDLQGFIPTDDVSIRFDHRDASAPSTALLAVQTTTPGAIFARTFIDVTDLRTRGVTKVRATAQRLSDPNWTTSDNKSDDSDSITVIDLPSNDCATAPSFSPTAGATTGPGSDV